MRVNDKLNLDDNEEYLQCNLEYVKCLGDGSGIDCV